MSTAGRRLRVLCLVDNAGDLGGAERFTIGLAQHLPHDRFETWVCATRTGAPSVVAALAETGVGYVGLGRRSKRDVYRLRGLGALLHAKRFDVIHAHMFGSNVWGTLFGRASGVPVILAHEHNWSYSGDQLRMWIDRWLIGTWATSFVAVSAANRERMVSLEHIPRDKIIVLSTAYIPHTSTTPCDIRAELALPAASPVVGVAAILREEKALDVLIDAHALVVRRIPDAHLVIAGDGTCRGRLEQQVAELGLGERIHFLGNRRDVTSILATVDVGAMSSDWEGMPLFVFECMATHTPLVATLVGGLPEIVEHGKTGLLVPPRDPAALGDAIAGLLADPHERERLADAAAQRMSEYTIESVAGRFADLYEQLHREATGRRTSKARGRT
jgi:glycosyltransferase involved in cell wall biosynthesis